MKRIMKMVVLLTLASLACSLPFLGRVGRDTPETGPLEASSADNQVETPTAPASMEFPLRVANAEGEMIYIEEPADDFLLNINQRITAGEVTEAQALIQSLKPLAGETPDVDLYQDQNVDFFEATGLVSQANTFLQNSDDEAAKQEIERLLTAILPPLDTLTHYARPEGEAAGASLNNISYVSGGFRDEAACRALWAEGFPEDDASSLICLLYADLNIAGNTHRIYYPESKRTNPAYMTYVRLAQESLQKSIETYAPFGPMHSATIIFALLQDDMPGSSGTTRAMTDIPKLAADPELNCPIIIFPAALGESEEWFRQIVAHEVFHCAESWLLNIDGVHSDSRWYLEGMANYFSNVVYPEINFEHRFQSSYDVKSLTLDHYAMSYETSTIFQFLGNVWGDSKVFGMLNLLNPHHDFSSQAGALVGDGLDNDLWHQFGQAYLDKEIMDTGGGPLPITPYFRQVHRVESSVALALESDSFVLARDLIRFHENSQFDIAVMESGLRGQNAVKPWPDGAGWGPVPSSFRSRCGDSPYALLMTSAQGSTGSYGLVLDIAMSDERECDSCLVGTWRQDQAESARILREIVGGLGTVEAVSGERIMQISGEGIEEPGRVTVFPIDACATFIIDDLETRVCLQGISRADYSIPEQNRIRLFNEQVIFILTLTSESGSVTIPLSEESMGSFSLPETWDYLCDENALTAFTGAAAPFGSSTYQRTSPVPTPVPPEEDEAGGEPGGAGSFEGLGGADNPACEQFSLSGFSADGASVDWTLVNDGLTSVVIESVSLDWPGANGAWSSISMDGAPVWNGDEALSPAIVSSTWEGTEAQRVVEAEEAWELELGFTDEVAETGYILVLDFSNSCVFSAVE